MPRHWSRLEPVTSTAIASRSYTVRPGDFPPSGPELDTTGRPRALIGWNHQNDTPDGLMKGQVYADVSTGKGLGKERLCIYDTSGNRSANPGEVVFCGVANFTMVRMFHPYWAQAGPDGTIPRDMAWGDHKDKANLRRLYHEFLVNYYGTDAADQPIYQIPVRPLRAPTVADTTKGDASSSKPKEPKKPRKPRAPKQPKSQRTTGSAKTRGALFGNEAPMTLTTKIRRRLAAENDGESVKTESRSTSVIDLATTPTHQERIDLTLEDSSFINPIDLIDLTGLAEAVEKQATAYSPPTDDSAQTNLVDDYLDDPEDPEEDARLLAEWQTRTDLLARGAPTSPALSNEDVQESIEVEEQDAQVQARDSENTVVEEDMEMIETGEDVVKVNEDDWQEGTDGSTVEDAIVLD